MPLIEKRCGLSVGEIEYYFRNIGGSNQGVGDAFELFRTDNVKSLVVGRGLIGKRRVRPLQQGLNLFRTS